MKKTNRIIAAIMSAAAAVSTAVPVSLAYTDGIHDTDRMTAVPGFSFRFMDKDLLDASENISYYNEEDDSIYVKVDAMFDGIVYTLADGVDYEEVNAAFEAFKAEALPDGAGYTEEKRKSFVILSDGDKVYSPHPASNNSYLTFAKFCQKYPQFFKAAEKRRNRKFLYKMGDRFFLAWPSLSRVEEYISSNGLDCGCRKKPADDGTVVLPDYKEHVPELEESLVELIFPEGTSTYERAETAFSVAKGLKTDVIGIEEEKNECEWEGIDLLTVTNVAEEVMEQFDSGKETVHVTIEYSTDVDTDALEKMTWEKVSGEDADYARLKKELKKYTDAVLDDIQLTEGSYYASDVSPFITADITREQAERAESSGYVLSVSYFDPAPPTVEATVEWSTESTMKGDANCDYKVNVADAVKVLQSIANSGKYPMSVQGRKNADVDGEAGITPNDALTIQRMDAGIQ